MPNWCSTEIIFNGSYNEILYLKGRIEDWVSKEYIETGFGKSWLGNVLYGAGLKKHLDSGEETLSHRGSVSYISDLYENGECSYIIVETETAWVPMIKMWVAVLKSLGMNESVDICYKAEEVGCGVYEIYDTANLGFYDDCEYKIDAYGYYGSTDISCYYGDYTKEGLIETLQELLETDDTDLATLISECERINQQENDSYMGIFEYDRTEELYE